MDPVTERHRSVSEVLSAHRSSADSAVQSLEKRFTPSLEAGRPMPDLLSLQQFLAAELERSWRRLFEADEAWHDALACRHTLVGERDEQVSLLFREVVDLRLILRGRFGTEPAKRFIGLRGDTSRDPIVLLKQADRAVARLRNLSRPLPASKLPVSKAARTRWAVPIAEVAEELRPTVTRLVMAFKEVDATGVARRRALGRFNEDFVTIAGTFESHYRLIGRDDLAKAVRPSKTYPGLIFLHGKRRPERRAKARKKPEGRLVRFPSFEPGLRLPGVREGSS